MWIAVGVCLFFIILVVFICGDLKHSNILINWEGGHQRFINVKIPRISFYDYTAYEEHLSIFRSIRLISPWSMPVLFGYFLWSTRHFSLWSCERLSLIHLVLPAASHPISPSSTSHTYLSLLNITHTQHTHTHTHTTPPHTTPNTDYSDIFPIICFRLFYSLLHLFSEDCYIFHCTVSFGIGTINDWSSDKGKSPILSRWKIETSSYLKG